MKQLFLILIISISAYRCFSQVNPVDSASIMDMYYSWNMQNCTVPSCLIQMPTLPASQWCSNISFNSNGRVEIIFFQNYYNCFSGPISPSIENLTDLMYFYLRDFHNAGTIPPEIGQLTNLQTIYFENNDFSGTLPDEICNLTNIEHILIGGSHNINGPIPLNIGNLSRLKEIHLSNLNIVENIPSSITNIDTLNSLMIQCCPRFGGIIPNFLCQMPSLQSLFLVGCAFYGPIPTDLGNTNLYGVYLDSNALSGVIPLSICEANHQIYVSLAKNELDSIPVFLPHTMGSSVYFLDVRFNKFTFEDFEPLVQNGAIQHFICGATNCGIHPQDSVWYALDTTVLAGTPVYLNSTVGGTANIYQWYKNGSPIPGATLPYLYTPSVTHADSGTYTCRIWNSIVTSPTGLILNRHRVKINVVDTLVGIEAKISESISIFPNPANEVINVVFNEPPDCEHQIIICDTQSKPLEFYTTKEQVTIIDISKYQQGIYWVRVLGNNIVKCEKVIKQTTSK